MNSKSKRRLNHIRKLVKEAVRSGSTFSSAQIAVLAKNSSRVTDGGTHHTGPSTRFAVNNI
jgi:hypothetical protein